MLSRLVASITSLSYGSLDKHEDFYEHNTTDSRYDFTASIRLCKGRSCLLQDILAASSDVHYMAPSDFAPHFSILKDLIRTFGTVGGKAKGDHPSDACSTTSDHRDPTLEVIDGLETERCRGHLGVPEAVGVPSLAISAFILVHRAPDRRKWASAGNLILQSSAGRMCGRHRPSMVMEMHRLGYRMPSPSLAGY